MDEKLVEPLVVTINIDDVSAPPPIAGRIVGPGHAVCYTTEVSPNISISIEVVPPGGP